MGGAMDKIKVLIITGSKSDLPKMQECEQMLDPGAEHYFDYRARRSAFWHSRRGNFVIPARLLTLALTGWVASVVMIS